MVLILLGDDHYWLTEKQKIPKMHVILIMHNYAGGHFYGDLAILRPSDSFCNRIRG